jgi:hypothetical protein
MFIGAIMYDLSNPDDGSCELYATEVTCLSEMSSLSNERKCFWNDYEMLCHLKDIENNMMLVMGVALFTAFLSTPFANLFQVLIHKYLSADIKENKSLSDTRCSRRINDRGSKLKLNAVGISDEFNSGDIIVKDSNRNSISFITSLSKNSESTKENNLPTTLQEDLSSMFADLRAFRQKLSVDDRNVFDSKYFYICILLV